MLRYRARIFLEGVPLQAWSVQAVAEMLKMVRIDAVELDSLHKIDTSYFILYAWIELPDKLPRWIDLGTHEPQCNIDPMDHLRLPLGFVQMVGPDMPLPACPRIQDGLVLVHLDELEEFASEGGAPGQEGGCISVRPLPWAHACVDGARSAPSAPGRPSVFSRLADGEESYHGHKVTLASGNKVVGFSLGGERL